MIDIPIPIVFCLGIAVGIWITPRKTDINVNIAQEPTSEEVSRFLDRNGYMAMPKGLDFMVKTGGKKL